MSRGKQLRRRFFPKLKQTKRSRPARFVRKPLRLEGLERRTMLAADMPLVDMLGDLDCDNSVDGMDFMLWQQGIGADIVSQAIEELQAWLASFDMNDELCDEEEVDDEDDEQIDEDEEIDMDEEDEQECEDCEEVDEGVDDGEGDDEQPDEGEHDDIDCDNIDEDETGDDDIDDEGNPDDGEEDEADEDIFATQATLVGTEESEKLQGYESDDVSNGGGGADLFPFTTGNDVITDFNPSEDMIDVGDFARPAEDPTEDYQQLTSLEAIAAASTEITDDDGVTSLVIDVDGELGDSTTTLVGVTLADLNASNVFFGLEGTSIPPLEFTHIPDTTVALSDDTVANFAGHDLSVHPLPFELVSGNQESVDVLNGDLFVEDDDDEGEGDEEEAAIDSVFAAVGASE